MPTLIADEVTIPLEQTTSLKGLLRAFKGKRELSMLVDTCVSLRDELIQQTLPRTVERARVSPLHLLSVQLSSQSTHAGTTFLRWRRVDRTAMGVAQWQALLLAPNTPEVVVPTLYRLEQQRVLLNAQISLLHALAQITRSTLEKLVHAEDIYQQRKTGMSTEAS